MSSLLDAVRNSEAYQLFKDFPHVHSPKAIGLVAEALRLRIDSDEAVWQKRFKLLRDGGETEFYKWCKKIHQAERLEPSDGVEVKLHPTLRRTIAKELNE